MRRLCGKRTVGNTLLHFGQLYFFIIYSEELHFGQARQGNIQSRIVHLSSLDIFQSHWLHANAIAHLEEFTCLSNIDIKDLTTSSVAA